MLSDHSSENNAPSGLADMPSLPWGTHVGHLFSANDELYEIFVPYFRAGLHNNERCLWVTDDPFDVSTARDALRNAVPDLEERERKGQIRIASASEFYDPSKPLPIEETIAGLLQTADEALALGFKGLRKSGNCSWVGHEHWHHFQQYESLVQRSLPGRRLICMCSYSPKTLHANHMMDLIDRHDLMLRHHKGKLSSTSTSGIVLQDLNSRRRNERQLRTFDLAMLASQMGTWRYTLADNACVFDEHAQRLYGLTEPRLVHDDEGVRAKFHPDDRDLMWSRVARAIDPNGDGRYEMEYRVKQPDGSWRWLSAWGTVEFEGEGESRKAVAISGASRDLTEFKKAAELQRLLVNELDHRVKNTLATVQAIVASTLRRATDVNTAREAIEQRIGSLSRAHDLLTRRSWLGADLRDLVHRALKPFPSAQLVVSGPSVEIAPNHALALSLALHELATNATKYGALSIPEGRVELNWTYEAGRLKLVWLEVDGPRVKAPSRRGFGSRLLEASLGRNLGGGTRLEFAPEGVRCEFDLAIEKPSTEP